MAVGREELKMRRDPHRWNSVLKEWINLDPTQGPKTRGTEPRGRETGGGKQRVDIIERVPET